MEESEENMSAEDLNGQDSLLIVRTKPKKRSLVERELETNLTARVTSPISNVEAASTSRYGRARRLKTDSEFITDADKIVLKTLKSPTNEKTPIKVQSPVYKMHASNSPLKLDVQKCTPKRISIESNLENQIENIYHENISLSRFGSEEKKIISPSKTPKVYIRKDLIQKREKDEETVSLIKNIFSPVKSTQKSNSHLSNILERSSEKYSLTTGHNKSQNGYASVVKTLDFDNKKKKKDSWETKATSKSDLFDIEAKCEYQVGDLAWARMGTYPFWPCIVTREPMSGLFVKKKLFGRIEHDIIHVTFFGDNGRRSWIVDNLLRKFVGQLEFEATRDKFTPSDKKKDPRFYAAFFISEKKQAQWNISVQEAEMLLREPKRLRIDILYDMLHRARAVKTTPKQNKSGKITRTASDVSLSESLYDTLFSEDDGKAEDTDRSRNKLRNKSLDVSDVVTACLDNMAAKTGITKIQKQSHMDRWLQKAKSKTPEKSQAQAQAIIQKAGTESKPSSTKKKKSSPPKPVILKKPYSFRKYANESQKSLPHYFDHDYSTSFEPKLNSTLNNVDHNSSLNDIECIEELQSGIGIISKVESLSDSINSSVKENSINNEDIMNIDNSSPKLLVEENDTDSFLSENIEINKVNILYDIEIVVDATSVPDEDQNKIYESVFSTEEKLDTALNLSEETKSDDFVNRDTTEKSNQQRELEEVKKNDEIVNKCTDEDYQSKLVNNQQQINVNESNSEPDILKSITEVKEISDNEVMKANEIHLNEGKSITEVKINENIENVQQTTLVDKHEHVINEALPKTDIKNSVSEVIVNENTERLIEKDIERDDFFLDKDNKIMEVELTDNAEMSIDVDLKPDQIVIDEDCDSIVNSINAILEDNIPSDKLTEDIPGSSSKIMRHVNQTEVCENATGNRSDVIDEQKVQEKKSENIFKSVSIHITNAESKTMSDADQSKSSEVFEDTTRNRSDVIEGQNVQKDNYENNSFKFVTTSVSKTESEIINNTDPIENNCFNFGTTISKTESGIMSNTDQSELSKDTADNSSDGDSDKKNMQDESLENISFESENISKPTEKSKFIEQKESFTGLIENCNQEDSFQDSENMCKAFILTKTKPETRSYSDGVKFDGNNSNELNEKTDLESENMKTSQDICSSRAHYVAFKESTKVNEDDLFAHLPEIESLITEQPKKSEVPVDEKLKTAVVEATEEVSKPKENVEDRLPSGKLTIKINNDKDFLQTDKVVNAETDQAVSDCILEKTKDKFLTTNSCNSDSVPISSNSIDPSIASVSDSLMVNGFHTPKYLEDFEADTSSLNSEDIEPLSVTKSKMLKKKVKSKLEDPDFVTYLEMRQDDLIAEHPELNEIEIVEYLYKTWMYEENAKSDIRKNDDIQQSNLVKGLEPHVEPSRKRSTKNKKNVTRERKKRNAVDNSDFDTASVKSVDSGTSMKRWLRPKKSALYNEIFFDDSRGTTPEIVKEEIDMDAASLCSIESELSIQTPNNEVELIQDISMNSGIEISVENKTDAVTIDSKHVESVPSRTNSIASRSSSSTKCQVNGFKEQDLTEKKIKVENDSETVSINSASNEVTTSKRKQKPKYEDKNGPSLDDPEFIKYLELRQDILIDENPQLTHEEIVGYLYKTWLYEESVKSDIKKTDEIEQSNLVKGLKPDQDVQRKKNKKKIKVEKDLKDFIVHDDVTITIKDKPKRKTAQSNYYKEDFSDIEDEIEMFEIMKGKPIPQVHLIKLPNPVKSSDDEVVEIIDEVDEVELYFEELTKPKPNLFKGLIREKVCEICERTGNLVKCKGCNSMFHIDCVKKESQVVEIVPLPLKAKKKRKKPVRKLKSLEDSESQSDEKSQDVSAELDLKIEPQPHTVDAENFEAQLEAKMKELLESNQADIQYDSYSSDDGIDWSDSVAGKCEIVDVKLKRKTPIIDYTDFKCNNCQKYDGPTCFVCKLAISKTGVKNRQRCQVAHCHKYYHLECLEHWPQTQFTSGDLDKKTNEVFENLMCPRHVCHTCVSDDPRGCKTRFCGDKLARCVRCPATYHSFTKCIPAGTKILTGSHIICPRHYDHRPGKVPCHVNTGWCFICAVGGTLICCEYCPTSFHAECLNIKPPEGSYMCEDCETGRLPLYGEMVWVKLGHYRWWPGIILHPSEIPDNLLAVKHSLGDFVVRFFGQYDHYWVNRGRVFPFQEGDSGRISTQKSKIDADFTTAMEHAYRACEILKNAPPNEEESLDIASSLLPPHYVKLKVNKPCGSLCGRRVDIEESSLTQCDCNPDEDDPCGPYSQCLNRMLLTECGPICRAGERCNNRAFEKRLYPKLVPYRTPHRGWGLKTLEDIKAGQFVIEYVGELIDEEEFKRRMNRKHEIRDENFYFLTLDKERMIDAGPKGNLARFMNHCCEPNCETQKWTVLGDVRVGLFAIHDIPANSEVTFNYNLECAGIDKKKCLCGAKRCPGYIGAKPKQDESQTKKSKFAAKRTYKKRKNTEESPSTKNKSKRPVGRPTKPRESTEIAKPRELTEIEKDLLIIKNATNGLSSDSDCSRLSSFDGDKNQKALKRKRVSFSTEDSVVCNGGKSSPSVKKIKLDKDKSESVVL